MSRNARPSRSCLLCVAANKFGQTGGVSDAVGPHPQYDEIADEYLDHARDNLFDAHYDRPACLALLGDVAGRTVLDAACGPGLSAEELATRGADVIGFDQSPRWSNSVGNASRQVISSPRPPSAARLAAKSVRGSGALRVGIGIRRQPDPRTAGASARTPTPRGARPVAAPPHRRLATSRRQPLRRTGHRRSLEPRLASSVLANATRADLRGTARHRLPHPATARTAPNGGRGPHQPRRLRATHTRTDRIPCDQSTARPKTSLTAQFRGCLSLRTTQTSVTCEARRPVQLTHNTRTRRRYLRTIALYQVLLQTSDGFKCQELGRSPGVKSASRRGRKRSLPGTAHHGM